MAQLQNVVLADREATPVNHTFIPVGISPDGLGTVEESTGVPIGNSRVQIGVKKTSTGRYKVSLKGSFPVVQNQTINGVTTPTVVRTSYVDMSFTFEGTSSTQERKNVIGMMASALDPSKVLPNDSLVNLAAVY